MKKELLESHVNKVAFMDRDSLEVFARAVSVSSASDESKGILNKYIDSRFKELDRVSVLLEESEIALFENEGII
jgi:hypothetical protein